MQTNENVPRVYRILSQAIAYLIGGMFLLTVSATSPSLAGRVGVIGQIFGYLFIGIGILLGISAFSSRLAAWANRLDEEFLFSLLLVDIVDLTFVVVGSTKYQTFFVVLLLAFLFVLIVAPLFWLFRSRVGLGTRIRSRVVWAGLLRRLSVALSLFALVMVIAQVSIMGGPILYLAISLVCLGIASLL